MGRGGTERCGVHCAKCMLFVFNIIFWLSGVALLGLGIWILADPGLLKILRLVQISDEKGLEYAAYVLIAMGGFVFIVGFLGFCGAIKENRCLLGMYIFFLVVVMAGEVGAAVIAVIFKEKIQDDIDREMKKTFMSDPLIADKERFTAFGALVFYAQVELLCCGIHGPRDYLAANTTGWPPGIKILPTCCPLNEDADLEGAAPTMEWINANVQDFETCQNELGKANSVQIFRAGCDQELKTWVNNHSVVLIGVGIGIACLEIFGILLSFCLCRSLKYD